MEHHPGTASWAQAVGATLAVIAAVLVPALQSRHTKLQLEADRRLRAKSLAIAIYPELLHIRVAHVRIVRRLKEIISRQHGNNSSRIAIAGADLAEEERRLTIPITETLRGLVPSFYLLGDPIGPQVQKCIGRSMKYNDLLNASFGLATVNYLPGLLTSVETGLSQTETCIAAIEQTWQISGDEAHALEDHLTDHSSALRMVESKTASKETV